MSSFKEEIKKLTVIINNAFNESFELDESITTNKPEFLQDVKHIYMLKYNECKSKQYEKNPLAIQIQFVIDSQKIFNSILLKDNFDENFDSYCDQNYDQLEINKRLEQYKTSQENYNLHYKVLEFYLYNIFKICIHEIYKLDRDIDAKIVDQLNEHKPELFIEEYHQYYTGISLRFKQSFNILNTIIDQYEKIFIKNNLDPAAYHIYKILKILFFNVKFILKLFFYDINLDCIYLHRDTGHYFDEIFNIQKKFYKLPFKKMDKLYIGPNPFNDISILNIDDITKTKLFELRLSTLNLFPLRYSLTTDSLKGGGFMNNSSNDKIPNYNKEYKLMSFNIFKCKGFKFGEDPYSGIVGSQDEAISNFIIEQNVDILCIQENNDLKIKNYNRLTNKKKCKGTDIYINKEIPKSKDKVICIKHEDCYAVVMSLYDVKIATLHINGDKYINEELKTKKDLLDLSEILDSLLKQQMDLLKDLVEKHQPDIICGDFNSVYSDDEITLEEFLKNQYKYFQTHLNKYPTLGKTLSEKDKNHIKKNNFEPFNYLKKKNYIYAIPAKPIRSKVTILTPRRSVDFVWYKNNKITKNDCEIINEPPNQDELYLSIHFPVLFKFKFKNQQPQDLTSPYPDQDMDLMEPLPQTQTQTQPQTQLSLQSPPPLPQTLPQPQTQPPQPETPPQPQTQPPLQSQPQTQLSLQSPPQPLTQQQDVEFDKTIEKLKKIKNEPCLFRFDKHKHKNSLNETYEDYFDHQFDYLFKRHTMKYYVIYESL